MIFSYKKSRIKKPSKVVILLSGGLDSGTLLAYSLSLGLKVIPVTFSYGQINSFELLAAKTLCEHFELQKQWVMINLGSEIFSGSRIVEGLNSSREKTSPSENADKAKAGAGFGDYVPARNSIFLAMAASIAESQKAEAILIGSNKIDFPNFPDSTPNYFLSFNNILRLGTKAGLQGKTPKIESPFLHLDKGKIIKIGLQANFDYSLTTSCYVPEENKGKPCRRCLACKTREEGFFSVGIEDPLLQKNGI